ncbi:ferritin family protein [Wenzhouxiangella sp. AB-CW3]|uniref:ferritin-like domain-containing protein n=1 Tax=Wenzhouxiangella sp. AB-CW3 TaxID=2771012 RepID=UPI00168B071D|nr:ferritin family protein [Wenzhouxiangella sp. AB-CW3]QOC22481.1 ferritin family protein [Wenzhouxiangella sp. AB-CW3]
MKPTSHLGCFLAHAVVLEDEAATRYRELADAMAVHNNPEVEALFRKMAEYSDMHRAEAVSHAEQHANGLPDLKPWEFEWPGNESPESGRLESAHYMMTPYHALELALQAEQGAFAFYDDMARRSELDAVRALAREFAEEEAGHVRALEKWLAEFPEPPENWADDLDPPVDID